VTVSRLAHLILAYLVLLSIQQIITVSYYHSRACALQGWGKRYDEWVAQSGLVKYDADVAAKGGKPGADGGPPGKRRRVDGTDGDAEREASAAPEEEEKAVEARCRRFGGSVDVPEERPGS
jgi:hypothetical protein